MAPGGRIVKTERISTGPVVTLSAVWVKALWILIGTNWPALCMSEFGEVIREVVARR
jgi:hypothetical protein